MIDTIRLKIDVEVKEGATISNITKISGVGCLKYKIFQDQIQLGSFAYQVSLFVNDDSELFVEYSVPKFIYGDNIHESGICDFEKSVLSLADSLSDYFVFADVETWEVVRCDCCSYIRSDNPYSDIYLFQAIDFPRQDKHLYDTSVMFKGRTFSTKFYIKGDEFLAHDYRRISVFDYHRANVLLEKSKNLIRVETTYRSQALKNITKRDKITVTDFVASFSLLQSHFKGILKKLNGDISPRRMKLKCLLEELSKKYPPAVAFRIYQFWQFWSSDSYNKHLVKKYYPQSTMYRYLKIISEILRDV